MKVKDWEGVRGPLAIVIIKWMCLGGGQSQTSALLPPHLDNGTPRRTRTARYLATRRGKGYGCLQTDMDQQPEPGRKDKISSQNLNRI